MSAIVRQLADAVTALLNANQSLLLTEANYATAFPPPAPNSFTASRVYLPNYEIDKSPGLQLFVLGLGQAYDVRAGDREGTLDTYTVKIAVYRQIDRDSNAQPSQLQMDAMADFVEATIGLLKATKFITGYAAWNLLENEPVYDPVSLDQKNTFVSVITIQYQCFF